MGQEQPMSVRLTDKECLPFSLSSVSFGCPSPPLTHEVCGTERTDTQDGVCWRGRTHPPDTGKQTNELLCSCSYHTMEHSCDTTLTGDFDECRTRPPWHKRQNIRMSVCMWSYVRWEEGTDERVGGAGAHAHHTRITAGRQAARRAKARGRGREAETEGERATHTHTHRKLPQCP
mmetsp:Transcript_46409/g.115490  ORF Transcript_46409/g.115490 Transcript_46409/m.115490 type:complete len:175 (-) Transcript_46409:1450-1974(-)